MLLVLLTGCGPEHRSPIRIGVTSFELSPLPGLLPNRGLFQRDLEQQLGKPVVFDVMMPGQICVHLGSGRAAFALLTTADYAEIAPACRAEILTVVRNRRGGTHRQGLIIAAPGSRVKSLADARSMRIHFLPRGDAINEAALGALLEAGLDRREIDRGILGLQLDTTHLNSMEVAKSVVLEDAIGVIDEADYLRWPERGGSLVLLSPSKEEVRVIGRTIRVPEGPFVASLGTPPELRQKVRRYLLEHANRNQLVLDGLGIGGFAEPIDPREYEPYFALRRKLYPNVAHRNAGEVRIEK